MPDPPGLGGRACLRRRGAVPLTFVDGDTGRVSVVTVGGNSFNLPTDGTGDNDWSDTQTVTLPVTLTAGENTVEFANPGNYAADVSQIAL